MYRFYGEIQQRVSYLTSTAFLERLEVADAAWATDAIPSGVINGVTLTIEQATADEYRRVWMVEPPEDSIHARLLDAWMVTFPEIAIALT